MAQALWWCTSEKLEFLKKTKLDFWPKFARSAVSGAKANSNASKACISREECNGCARLSILQREYMHAHGCFALARCWANTAFSRLIFDSQRTPLDPLAPHCPARSAKRTSVLGCKSRQTLALPENPPVQPEMSDWRLWDPLLGPMAA